MKSSWRKEKLEQKLPFSDYSHLHVDTIQYALTLRKSKSIDENKEDEETNVTDKKLFQGRPCNNPSCKKKVTNVPKLFEEVNLN